MAVENYQHSVIRDDVLEEFGKDIANSALKAKATRKINDAIHFIARQKPDWPWKLWQADQAVTDGTAVTGTVTGESTSVTSVTPNAATDVRRYWVDGSVSAPGTVGYLITVRSTGTYTLASQYLGSDATAKAATIMDGVFALPADFEKMQSAQFIGSLADAKFDYVTPLMFEEIRRKGDLRGVNNYVYTIKQDPASLVESTQYMLVYPYLNEVATIHYTYWRTSPSLVADGNVPIVPVEDRLTLLQVAYWFMAAYLKEDLNRIMFYKEQALEGLAAMMDGKELGNEPTTFTEDSLPGYIRMPAGYPAIRNLG